MRQIIPLAALFPLLASLTCVESGCTRYAVTITDGRAVHSFDHTVGIGMKTDTYLYFGNPYGNSTLTHNIEAEGEGSAEDTDPMPEGGEAESIKPVSFRAKPLCPWGHGLNDAHPVGPCPKKRLRA